MALNAPQPTPYQEQPILLVGCGRNPERANYGHENGKHSLHHGTYHNQIPAAVRGHFASPIIEDGHQRDSDFNGEHCYTIDLFQGGGGFQSSNPHYNGDFNGTISTQFLDKLLGKFDMVIIDSAGNLKRMLNNEVEYAKNAKFVPEDAESYGVGSVSMYLNNCLKVLKPGGMLVMAVGFL